MSKGRPRTLTLPDPILFNALRNSRRGSRCQAASKSALENHPLMRARSHPGPASTRPARHAVPAAPRHHGDPLPCCHATLSSRWPGLFPLPRPHWPHHPFHHGHATWHGWRSNRLRGVCSIFKLPPRFDLCNIAPLLQKGLLRQCCLLHEHQGDCLKHFEKRSNGVREIASQALHTGAATLLPRDLLGPCL